jgi:hypothetical protein
MRPTRLFLLREKNVSSEESVGELFLRMRCETAVEGDFAGFQGVTAG